MNINPKAWYHQIYKFFDSTPPENLCPYVRRTSALWAFALSAFAALCFMFMLVGFGLIQFICTYFGLDPLVLSDFSKMAWWMWPTALAGGVAVVAALFAALIGATKLQTLYKAYRWKKGIRSLTDVIEESDNIAVKYMVAKHNKICPRLTFKEKE
jgi:hypothetical protein